MADRVPTETIELVLSLAFDPPNAEDVDVERERARRALLWAAALVCRRWRPAAEPMLPRSIVIRNVAELEWHHAAQRMGGLRVADTVSLTIGRFAMRQCDRDDLNALVVHMTRLHYCRSRWPVPLGCSARWPGRHLVPASVVGARVGPDADNDPADFLERSITYDRLSVLSCVSDDGSYSDSRSPFRSGFARRVQSLRLGSEAQPFRFHGLANAIGPGPDGWRMDRLRVLRWHFPAMWIAAYVLAGPGLSGGLLSRCPQLKDVHLAVTDVRLPSDNAPNSRNAEVNFVGQLLRALSGPDIRLTWCLRGTAVADGALDVLTQALAQGVERGAEPITLVVDVGQCVDEAWRSSADVLALEAACAAKGVEFELRT